MGNMPQNIPKYNHQQNPQCSRKTTLGILLDATSIENRTALPLSLSSNFKRRYLVLTCPKAIKVCSPAAHHAVAFWQMLGTVVGPSVRVAHCVRQLVFYEVVPLAENFIKQGAGYGPKSVRRQSRYGSWAYALPVSWGIRTPYGR